MIGNIHRKWNLLGYRWGKVSLVDAGPFILSVWAWGSERCGKVSLTDVKPFIHFSDWSHTECGKSWKNKRKRKWIQHWQNEFTVRGRCCWWFFLFQYFSEISHSKVHMFRKQYNYSPKNFVCQIFQSKLLDIEVFFGSLSYFIEESMKCFVKISSEYIPKSWYIPNFSPLEWICKSMIKY